MKYFQTNHRKLRTTFLVVFSGVFMMTILCGCPFQSVYQIDAVPQFQVDDVYYGNWETVMVEETGKSRNVKMNLSPKNDNEYNIYFCGNFGRVNKKNQPQMDTVWGTAFVSLVENKQFININIDTKIYIAEFQYKNDKISLFPLCDHFTSFYIRSNDQLRERISYHYRTRLYPLFDESFTLKNMTRVK
jgi:hypothetical protein